MLDSGPFRHPSEQLLQPRILDPPLGPLDEFAMDVVARNGSGEGIDVRSRLTQPKNPSGPSRPRLQRLHAFMAPAQIGPEREGPYSSPESSIARQITIPPTTAATRM